MPDYYFSNSTGNDANPGTIASPKKTLSAASALTLNGPDRVLFMRGDTWTESAGLAFSVKNVGSLTVPVTVGAYGTGADPIIDLTGHGAATVGITVYNSGAFIVEDIHIKNAGAYGVLVDAFSGATPGEGNCGGFILRRVEIDAVTGTSVATGVLVTDDVRFDVSDGVGFEITGCSIHDCNIDGVAIDSLITGWMVHGNTIYNCTNPAAGAGDAITAHAQSSGHHFFNNEVYNCKDGVHFACTSSSAMKVYGNYIHDCLENGVNLSRVDDLGIHEVYNNIIEVADYTGQNGGIMIGVEAGGTGGSTGTFRIYNNTIVVNKTGIPGISIKALNTGTVAGTVTMYNNVVTGVAGARMVKYDNPHASGGFSSWVATNNHYSEDSANVFDWDGTESNFASWQTNSGADANSVAGTDPLLSGDIALSAEGALPGAGSPLIGTGLNLSTTFTTDYTGAGRGVWDKGAYQYIPQPQTEVSNRSTLTRMGSQERFLASIGRTTMPAQNVQNFFFTEVGQLLRLSCDSGGIFLLTTDGSAPSADLSTEQGETEVIYCSRGSVEIFKPFTAQTVRLMCLSNATNVVLSLFGLKPIKWCD